MIQRLAAVPLFFVAIFILTVSIFEAASVKYVFSQSPFPAPAKQVRVDYVLPDLKLTPENPLWPFKVLVDNIDNSPESYLESADLRLVAGKDMFERGKIEEGIAVFEKGEMYLTKSLGALEPPSSEEKNAFLIKLSRASLKHREVLETILVQSPEDAKPTVATILDTPKLVYDASASALRSEGIVPPSNPF